MVFIMPSRPPKFQPKFGERLRAWGARGLPPREIRLLSGRRRLIGSTFLIAASVTVSCLFLLRPIPTPGWWEKIPDRMAGWTCGGGPGKPLPITRLGREIPQFLKTGERVAHEWQCIQAILEGGAVAVGVLFSHPPTPQDWGLSEKIAQARQDPVKRVGLEKLVLFSCGESRFQEPPRFQAPPPSIRYSTGSDQATFLARLLRAADLRTEKDFIVVQVVGRPERATRTLGGFVSLGNASPPPALPEFRGQIVLLAPSRDPAAWREWQALQTVAAEKISRPRPSGQSGLLWSAAALLVPPGLVFLPRRRKVRGMNWLVTPFFFAVTWVGLVFWAKLSPMTTPALISWLVAGGLALILGLATEILARLAPSPGIDRFREMIQGTRSLPVPPCWRRPLFRRPASRLLPVQRKAAALLAEGIVGSGHLPEWVDRTLGHLDAISTVRLWTENRR